MKKKNYLFLGLLFCFLTIILIYKSKDSKLNGKEVKEEKLSIMIKEEGAEDYTKSSSKEIPKGDYTLNKEKSYCKNNGKIVSYDSTLGKVSFAFTGTDRCFLYFDYKEKNTLYKNIKNRYESNNEFVGLYTGEESDTYQNKVYYFKNDVKDNNVLFADFCWKMVRTTETGGVKLIYNGSPKDGSDDYTLLNQSEYANFVNNSSYPYTFDDTDKTWIWTSSYSQKSGSIEITFSAPSDGYYILNYEVSLQIDNSSSVEIFKDDESQNYFTDTGQFDGQIVMGYLTTSNVIKIIYEKTSNLNCPITDNIKFSMSKTLEAPVKTCENTGKDSQIGESDFNSSYDSPAYVGYMYNNVYVYSSKTILNSSYFSGTKAYGDGVIYSNGSYTLTNATTLAVSSSNINTLVGKYTCNSSSTTGTCTNAWYIIGYNGYYIYYYSLSNGDLDGTDNGQNYVFGSSFTYTNGTYSLSDTTTINTDNWASQFTNVNTHHYTCLSSGTTCTSLYYVYFILYGSVYYITLTGGKTVEDVLNEMIYNDDVNTKDSTIKKYIDNWYKNNMINYTDKLEDTVFCNDRSRLDSTSDGWYPNGGSTSDFLYFKYNNIPSTPTLKCTNENDKFTVERSNGNGALTYPVGLLTVPETKLANYGSSNYLNSGQYVWLGSPVHFSNYYANVWLAHSSGFRNANVHGLGGVRPVISLKPGTEISSGDGLYTSPFEIK